MLSEFELKILADNMGTLINTERKARGLRELYAVPYLNECSEIRAEEASISYSHTRPNGEPASDVIDYEKFKYGYFAENLAAGSGNASDILNQWKNSSKNWAAIINQDITHMGIGVFYSPESEYKWYWCTIFTNDLYGYTEHEGQYLPEEIDLNRKISVISKDENGEILPDSTIVMSSENGTLEFVKLEKNGDSFTDFTISADKKSLVFQSGEVPVTILNIPTETYYDYYIRSWKSGYKSEKISFMMSADGTVLTGTEEINRNFVLEMKPQKLHIMFYATDYAGSTLILESSGDLSSIESAINFSLSSDCKSLSFTPIGQENIFEKLPHGSYKLYVQSVPDGYKSPDMLNFSITEETTEDVYQSLSLAEISAYFYCYGTNESSQQILVSGAEFTLTHLDGKPLENVTSNNTEINAENGSVSWISGNYAVLSRLPAGDYKLTENTPPSGFQKVQPITFSIDSKGNINNLINAVEVGTFGIKIIHLRFSPNLDTLPDENYITIYDMHTKQNNFENNGLAVLTPISCTVTESYNAEWSVTLEHPIDREQKWKYITEFNIIKVLGQLFVIKKVDHSWTGNSGKVTAYAEHVFYQMNDAWLKQGTYISGADGKSIIANALIWSVIGNFETGETTIYSYGFDSDLTDKNVGIHMLSVCRNKWNPIQNGMTPNEFLLGSDGFIANFGGELYRDNFYFSINKEMENALADSFDIHIGMNLTGIRRTIDTTSLCTSFTAFDKFGNGLSYFWKESYTVPHHILRSQVYDFGENYTGDMELLNHEAKKYFDRYSEPTATFTVTVEDVKNNPDYREFVNNSRYKVGDRGIIFDERLDTSIETRITKNVKNGLNGKLLEVVFSAVKGYSRGDYDISIEEITPIQPEESKNRKE